MARMVFADPFGSYTQGFREGQQDELALGMYNLGARRAGTDYEKALQDLRTGELDYGLRKTLDPYRIRSAEAQLFEQEADAAARGARMTRDPRVAQRPLSYFGPDYGFDEFGNLTTPGERFSMPARTFLEGADFGWRELPSPQQPRGGSGGGVGPWAGGYNFDFLSGTPEQSAPATQVAPTDPPTPEQSAALPPVQEDGLPWQIARTMGETYRGNSFPTNAAMYGPAFAAVPPLRSGVNWLAEQLFRSAEQPYFDDSTGLGVIPQQTPPPNQPMPEMYGPPAPVRPNPNDYYWLR